MAFFDEAHVWRPDGGGAAALDEAPAEAVQGARQGAAQGARQGRTQGPPVRGGFFDPAHVWRPEREQAAVVAPEAPEARQEALQGARQGARQASPVRERPDPALEAARVGADELKRAALGGELTGVQVMREHEERRAEQARWTDEPVRRAIEAIGPAAGDTWAKGQRELDRDRIDAMGGRAELARRIDTPGGRILAGAVSRMAPESEFTRNYQAYRRMASDPEEDFSQRSIGEKIGNVLLSTPVYVATGGAVNPIALFGGLNALEQTSDLAAGVSDSVDPVSFGASLAMGAVARYGVSPNLLRKMTMGGGAGKRIAGHLTGVGMRAAEAAAIEPAIQAGMAVRSGDWDGFKASARAAPERFRDMFAIYAMLNLRRMATSATAGQLESQLAKRGVDPVFAREFANMAVQRPEGIKALDRPLYQKLRAAMNEDRMADLARELKFRGFWGPQTASGPTGRAGRPGGSARTAEPGAVAVRPVEPRPAGPVAQPARAVQQTSVTPAKPSATVPPDPAVATESAAISDALVLTGTADSGTVPVSGPDTAVTPDEGGRIVDRTPEGFGPSMTEGEVVKPVVQRLKGETLDQAVEREVGYQIDNGRVRIAEDSGGWVARVLRVDDETPRVIRAAKRQAVLNNVWEYLNPDYVQDTAPSEPISPPAAEPGATAFDEGAVDEMGLPRVRTVEMPVADLTVQDRVRQFKRGADAKTGVVRGQGLQGQFTRLGTGPIVAWERLDGKTEVITGRNRLDLARRSGEETIPVQAVREADGFTQEMAERFDAEANIRDGQGEVGDYAHYFKSNTELGRDEAASKGLLGRAKGQAGWALGREASDDLYSLYQAGRISEGKAVAIATTAPGNAELQAAGIEFAREKGVAAADVENYLQSLLAQAKTRGPDATQGDMFGFDDRALKESRALAKAATRRQAQIKQRMSVLRAGSKVASKRFQEIAAEYGINVADPDALEQALASAETELAEWSRWATDSEKVAELRRETVDGVVSAARKMRLAVREGQELFGREQELTPFRFTLENTARTELRKRSDSSRGQATLMASKMVIGKAREMIAQLNAGTIDEAEAARQMDKAGLAADRFLKARSPKGKQGVQGDMFAEPEPQGDLFSPTRGVADKVQAAGGEYLAAVSRAVGEPLDEAGARRALEEFGPVTGKMVQGMMFAMQEELGLDMHGPDLLPMRAGQGTTWEAEHYERDESAARQRFEERERGETAVYAGEPVEHAEGSPGLHQDEERHQVLRERRGRGEEALRAYRRDLVESGAAESSLAAWDKVSYSYSLADSDAFDDLVSIADGMGVELVPVRSEYFREMQVGNRLFIADPDDGYGALQHGLFHVADEGGSPAAAELRGLVNEQSAVFKSFHKALADLYRAAGQHFPDVNEAKSEVAARLFEAGGDGSVGLMQTQGVRVPIQRAFSDFDQAGAAVLSVMDDLDAGLEAGPGGAERFSAREPDPTGVFASRPDPNQPFAVAVGDDAPVRVTMGGLDTMISPIRLPELVRWTKELTRVKTPVLRGGKLGYFDPSLGTEIVLDRRIFSDPAAAARTLTHEIGHMVDFFDDKTLNRGNVVGRIRSLHKFLKAAFGPGEVKDRELREELKALSAWWHPWERAEVTENYRKYRDSAVELYAEGLSVLLAAPAELKARAPKFYDAFFGHLDKKPTIKSELLKLWDSLNRPEEAIMADRAAYRRAGYERGDDLLRAMDSQRRAAGTFTGWRNDLKTQYLDRFWPGKLAGRRAKAVGHDPDPARDIEMLLDEHPFAVNNTPYLWMQRLHESVIKPAEAAEISSHDIGEWMELNRDANERLTDDEGNLVGRAGLANPGGLTAEEAEKELMTLRRTMGHERVRSIEGLAKTAQDLFWDVMQAGGKSGIFSAEDLQRLESNRYNYAPYAVVDRLGENPHIPAGIKRQVGTLNQIMNPLTAMTLKARTALSWAHYNELADVLVENLRVSGDAEEARVERRGRELKPVRPGPGKELITVMRDGEPNWYVVDKAMADMFNNDSPARNDAVLRVLNWVFRELSYPLYITYNAGWGMIFNPIRDFRRTVAHSPREMGMNLAAGVKTLREYGRAWRHAVNRIKGVEDPLVREMMENAAIGNPFESFTGTVWRDKGDYMGDILQKFHLAKPEHQSKLANIMGLDKLKALLDKIPQIAMTLESLPKISTYSILTRDLGWERRAAAEHIRTKVGTPYHARKGSHTALSRPFVPFLNIAAQGLSDSWKLGTGKGTRSTFWWRWARGPGMRVILKAMAGAGLLGAGIKKLFDGLSEHQKSNYDAFPIGTVPDEKSPTGESVFALRFPYHYEQQLLNSIVYQLTKGAIEGGKVLSGGEGRLPGMDEFSAVAGAAFGYAGSALPGLNPWIDVPSKWADYARDIEPRDSLRGVPVMPRDEFDAGGWPGFKGMLKFSFDQLGPGSAIRSVYAYDGDQEMSPLRVVAGLPLVNRITLLTHAGYNEQMRQDDEQHQKERARLRLMIPTEARERYWNYQRLKKAKEWHEAKGDRFPSELRRRYNRLDTWYRMYYRPGMESLEDAVSKGIKPRVARLSDPRRWGLR